MTNANLHWMRRGLCAKDVRYWDTAPELMKVRICQHCPVRKPCLRWAVDMEGDPLTRVGGVVGATVPEQRRRLVDAGADTRRAVQAGAA